jgi:uncharacterized protein
MRTPARPFWKHKRLEDMSKREWESLCDGCARCCLVKVPNPNGRGLVTTHACCELLDPETARCMHYTSRHRRVSDCVQLTPANVHTLSWLPPTCAYRLLARGEELPEWHPLVSGDAETVHSAGISMRGRVVSEALVHPDDLLRMRIRF